MNEQNYDFAIAGSSALAAMLALTLARTHGAKVCVIGHLPAPLQISRDIALSVGPYSRPETLDLLVDGFDAFRAFLSASELERRRVVFAALTETGHAATGHVRHMLNAHNIVTASLPDRGHLVGFTAEGIWILRPRAFFARLPERLDAAGVTVYHDVEDLQAGQTLVRFAANDAFIAAKRLVVTDAGCTDCLGDLPAGTVMGWRTALATDPVPALAGRLIVDIESSGHLTGLADGRIEAVAPSENEADAAHWLGALLARGTAARIVARRRFAVPLSRDGAPFVAPLPRKAVVLAIGFGASGAWFAPALAGFLTDSGSSAERAWFGARGVRTNRAGIAEIGLVGGGTP